MRRTISLLVVFTLLAGVVLAINAPETMSLVFMVAMAAIVLMGAMFGILPILQYGKGFQNGLAMIDRALEAKNSTPWMMMEQSNTLFSQKTLDQIFVGYRDKVRGQRATNQVMSDIVDYVNEDVLALHCWQNVVTQVPGTLTSLGILGTFLGLIIGVQGIGFSSVDAALTSVQTLLVGIQMAFYTSIAGVILSLLFNISYRLAWNTMVRSMDLFADAFHKNVIPTVEEQARYKQSNELTQIMEHLDKLPQLAGGGYSAASLPGAGVSYAGQSNESVLMPQILSALRNGEFIFFLQPRYDLNTRKLVGSEALVRWKHDKLGMVSPSVFIPVLENNGYITKLDQYIWEAVCSAQRRWIDAGFRPAPISVNVTKTDVLAIDIAEFFTGMVEKYNLPPRMIDIEIARAAYMQASIVTIETEEKLRQAGFKVVIDGFDGDYMALSSVMTISADELKLDMRLCRDNSNHTVLKAAFEQAQKMNLTLSVEGIENMEQLATLRKLGCAEGQGYLLSKPVSTEQYEALMNGETIE